MDRERSIAYFSMEIGLETGMPTYAGGLGVLAGDTVRSAADLKVPMAAVTLLHRKGYFYQKIDPNGVQKEEPEEWVVEDFLHETKARASVNIEGRTVQLRAWRYDVVGMSGFKVPVYFLDADLPENTEADRTFTHFLYGGDLRYRICQEVILGIGGVKMLRSLGHHNIKRFHMNEGHAAFLTVELLEEHLRRDPKNTIDAHAIEEVRKHCVFTTHTPVPAGHDQFPMSLVEKVLGRQPALEMKEVFYSDHTLNMTNLALNLSHYVNGVAKKHGEISREMFPAYTIDSITNGVHVATWTSKPFQELFDRFIAGWREDNFSLRYALGIPKADVWKAHSETKHELMQYVNHETNTGMDTDVLTLGFARRAAAYKRADLLFHDIERLQKLASKRTPIQVIYAGKAHPQDQAGKDLIRKIYQAGDALKGNIKIAYLQNYDMELGRMITAGVDLWLNTPEPPLEASGTSGMKAALNGVPSLSILDGWWIEGHVEGVTGWAIGETDDGEGKNRDRAKDAKSLYDKLEKIVIPMFYRHRDRFIGIMLHSIALNGSFFNTQRMMQQYVLRAYFH